MNPKLQATIESRIVILDELGERLGIGRVTRRRPTTVGDQAVYYFADRRSKMILPALYVASDGTVQSA